MNTEMHLFLQRVLLYLDGTTENSVFSLQTEVSIVHRDSALGV